MENIRIQGIGSNGHKKESYMVNIHPKIIELLGNRGITDIEVCQELLSEQPQMTYDPFLLHHMREGVDLLLTSIQQKKRICIYGDYDVDGITSIAILFTVLAQLTDSLEYYIPSRFDEGYGLNKDALKKLKDRGVDLVVTVDLGSVAVEEIQFAKEIGLEILVTDHHSIGESQGDCLMINPKKKECSYPFKDLAGCGVAYKLAQGIQRTAHLPKRVLLDVLDLLAIGTIGDIVPLVDENRTFAKYGIQKLNQTTRPGLIQLAEGASLVPGRIHSEQVSYVLVPHLNAAGRITDAEIALKVLQEDDQEAVRQGVDILLGHNRERRRLQEEAVQSLKKRVEPRKDNDLFYVIYTKETHEGIAGIVAGKLKDYYRRPVAIVTPTESGVKGTSRSLETINLYELLKRHKEFFTKFGGHAMACGFSMKEEDIPGLQQALNEDLENLLRENAHLFEPERRVDLKMDPGEITVDFVEALSRLAPFGSGWPKPVVKLENVELQKVIPMGTMGQFYRFQMIGVDGSFLKGVCFQQRDQQPEILSGTRADVYGTPEIHEYNGSQSLQLNVIEITRRG